MTPAQKDEEKRATGRRVREAREQARMTVTQLAERAGVPRQYVYDLEGGIRVSVTNVVAVARALSLTTDYLLIGHEENRAHSCCVTAADRDALHRFTKPGLLRLADGTYTDDLSYIGGVGVSLAEMATGDAVELIACGRYRWRGQEYIVGRGRRGPVTSSPAGEDRAAGASTS